MVSWQVPQQAADFSDCGNFVLDNKVGHAGVCVDLRPTQLIRRDVLAQHRFHNTGAGQTKERVAWLDDKAALARQIRAAPCVETKHAHNAGHHATDVSQRLKGLGVTVQAANSCGHIGTGGIVKPDDRDF